MAKSDPKLDAEIQQVSDMWDSCGYELGSPDSNLYSAIYHTLRWARGLREMPPTVYLRNRRNEAK